MLWISNVTSSAPLALRHQPRYAAMALQVKSREMRSAKKDTRRATFWQSAVTFVAFVVKWKRSRIYCMFLISFAVIFARIDTRALLSQLEKVKIIWANISNGIWCAGARLRNVRKVTSPQPSASASLHASVCNEQEDEDGMQKKKSSTFSWQWAAPAHRKRQHIRFVDIFHVRKCVRKIAFCRLVAIAAIQQQIGPAASGLIISFFLVANQKRALIAC